jgi:hypothetical protein
MDDMFVGYISHEDGKVHMFEESEILSRNEQMRKDPEFSYMYPSVSEDRFLVEQYVPYAIFNLNVTKEIRDIMTASFYVNNVTNTRVLHKNTASSGYTELGIPIFFGFELKVTLK